MLYGFVEYEVILKLRAKSEGIGFESWGGQFSLRRERSRIRSHQLVVFELLGLIN